MALSAYTGALSTSAGTGDKSETGVGFQPKAIIAFYNNQTATGSAADAHIGIGFTGTAGEDLSTYFNSLDGAASSDVVRSLLNTVFWKTTVGGATTARVTATLKTLDSDGFTVNTTANVTGAKLPYLALGGADITDAVGGQVAMPNSTSNFSVTGLSFQPSIVFLSVILLATNGTANNNNSFSFGVAHSSGVWCSAIKSQNAQATMNTSRAFYTGRCAVVLQSIGDTAVDEVGFVSMNSDGFTLSHPVNSGGTYLINYLAIKGGQWNVGNLSQPSSTGDQSVTGMAFQPVGTLFSHASYETVDTVTSTARIGIGAATSSSNRQSIWMGDEDAAANAKADQRYATDKVIMMYDEAGGGAPTVISEADYVSNNSDGFTINWSTVDSTARKVGYVSFGSNAVGGTAVKDIIGMGILAFPR
jgi:hypothetical protein